MSSRMEERQIRVFCPTHKISFETTGSKRILCENGKHTLAVRFPHEDFWEYCCDCQSFYPSPTALGLRAADHCPVCNRETARRSLCAHCKLVSIDSDTRARRKQYLIPPFEAASPACPGCGEAAAPDVLEHACEVIAATYATARAECPFCGEAISPPPAFPAKVSDFLQGIKSVRVRVTLDRKAKRLKPAKAGELVLVHAGNGMRLSIVLPAATHFRTEKDFSEGYSQLYDCDGPAVGEVVVIFPAVVEKVDGDWKLKSMGRLKVAGDEEPEPSEAAAPSAKAAEPPASEEALGPAAEQVSAGAELAAEVAGPEDEDDEEEAAPPPREPAEVRVEGTQNPALSAEGLTCLTCRAPVPPGLTECPACDAAPGGRETREDDASPGDVTGQGGVDDDPAGDKPLKPARRVEKRVMSIAAAALALLIVVVLAASYGSPSVESQLQEAMARNNLVTPDGKSAFDLYNKLKKQKPPAATMAEHEAKIRPLLTAHTYKFLADCYPTGISSRPASEWAEAAKASKWASELSPGDMPLAARAAFCDGHAAYLRGDRDEALNSWKRASDLDPGWAVAPNGVGIIYNERREYVRARIFLQEAVKRDAAWAVPYSNLGVSSYLEGNQKRAAEYWREAQSRAPRWAVPRYWLGKIALDRGDYATAVRELEMALADTSTGRNTLDIPAVKSDLVRALNSGKLR